MQGADVLRGRAFETSDGLSYQPLAQLLRQRLERENVPDDLLSDLRLPQLTRLLPELRDRYPDLPEPNWEEAAARQQLFEAIARLGRALAEHAPLVLFIDDWHWADTASLDVLHYAVLRWAEERTPILVLLTLRQESLAASPDMQNWLTRLKRDVAPVHVYEPIGDNVTSEKCQDESLMIIFIKIRKTTLSILRDVSEELARWLPEGEVNHILWLTGHIFVLVERCIFLLLWVQRSCRRLSPKGGGPCLAGIRSLILEYVSGLVVYPEPRHVFIEK